MSVYFHLRDAEACIQIHGHFNLALHGAFRDACKRLFSHTGLQAIEVDLMETEYLDSSALGMLLVLRDQAHDHGIRQILISNTRPAIRQLFSLAKFDTFFEIE